jgi:hypothetical protein
MAAVGDGDHDGQPEVLLLVKELVDDEWVWTTRFYELVGDTTYVEAQILPPFVPGFIGDLDGDGLGDAGGQEGPLLVLYEASTPSSLPSWRVWESSPSGDADGFPVVADADEDGRLEIIHSANMLTGASFLHVWENDGDNEFDLVYQRYIGSRNTGTKAVGDFDEDGKTEIAMGDADGAVTVFENTGNDNFQIVWTGDTGFWNALACVATSDMDGDGKPEFSVMGSDPYTGWHLRIYQASGNNHYSVVFSWDLDNGWVGVPRLAAGDVDGDDREELVMEAADDLFVLDAQGPGTWTQLAHLEEPPDHVYDGLLVHDANDNGFAEIFWLGLGEDGITSPNTTTVLEWGEVSSTAEAAAPPPGHLLLGPNPTRGTLRILGRTGPGWLRIYDAAGRLRLERPVDGSGRVDLGTLAPGTYFWQWRDARGDRTGRLVLLR